MLALSGAHGVVCEPGSEIPLNCVHGPRLPVGTGLIIAGLGAWDVICIYHQVTLHWSILRYLSTQT